MQKFLIGAAIAVVLATPALAQNLGKPHFHHILLNSTDPDAAAAFYVRQYANTTKTTWQGLPGVHTLTNAYILFNKVASPPPSDPNETSIWHFGWYVTNVRDKYEFFKSHPEVRMTETYGDDGTAAYVSSDVLGGTQKEIDDARAGGKKPAGGPGVLYIWGPDGALIENVGNVPVPIERFNHVHLYQNDPYCAQVWYQRHLNADVAVNLAPALPHTDNECKVPRGDKSFPALVKGGMYRIPASGVMFDDVNFIWPVNQSDTPLKSHEGHVLDRIALSVPNLDAWNAKLKGEGVKFLQDTHPLGDTRAFMIEGPSGERLEIVEVK